MVIIDAAETSGSYKGPGYLVHSVRIGIGASTASVGLEEVGC